MSDDIFKGYRGEALSILQKFNVRVWGQTVIETTRGRFEGTVLPRAENTDDTHIVVKIITGYNIGVSTNSIISMVETGYKVANYKIPEKEFPFTPGLPSVKLLGTGGTIASRLDYRTGPLSPLFHPENYMARCPN